MDIVGKTIQNGEPTPEHPIDIENKINLTGAIQILNKLKSKVTLVKVDDENNSEKEYRLPFLMNIEQQAIETVLSELEKKDEYIKMLTDERDTLIQERDYYKARYNEFNDYFLKNNMTIEQMIKDLKRSKLYERSTEDMGKYGIYKKSIKQIYDDLEHEEEQLFQIQDRKTYDKILKEMEKEINSFGYDFDEPFYLFEKDIQNNFKRIYFVIGKWRFGMCGIFVHDQCDDVYILCDTKEDDYSQDIHEKQINIFINILDKYRSSVIVSKKKYDDIRWKE